MPPDTGDSTCPTLILASASPRRRELLVTLDLPFRVMPAHVDERHHAAEPPESYVARLAQEKAGQLADQYPSAWVLGADTVVVLDQSILGKPADAAAARAMLGRLSGRQHTVMTGVAVVHRGRGMTQCDVVSTRRCTFTPCRRRTSKRISPPGSRSTRPAPMRFKALAGNSWRPWRGATTTWWACRCSGRWPCCGRRATVPARSVQTAC